MLVSVSRGSPYFNGRPDAFGKLQFVRACPLVVVIPDGHLNKVV
jgi:hypothetical protein